MVLAAVAVAGLAAAGLGVYLLDGGDGGSGGTSCLARAAARIPSVDEAARRSLPILSGGDLERARAAGFDDSGSFDDLVDSAVENSVLPDLLYRRTLAHLSENGSPPETAGYDSSQVSCWIALETGRASAAVGNLDEAAVASSERGEDGEVATDGGLLTYDHDGAAASRLDHEETVAGDLAE